MESIDKLRRHVYDTLTRSAAYPINDMIDEIEREVAAMVPLPKDADGVPIHVGDELEGYGYPNGGAYCKAIVGEWGILAGEQECNYQRWLLWSVDDVRHHHAPTVEDVLAEFSDELWNSYCIGGTASDSGVRELEAKYVARLRLAGEDA